MGRSYWFECEKCGYRALVSGKAESGLDYSVQTILCNDCRELYDAVTRVRVSGREAEQQGRRSGITFENPFRKSNKAPAFQSVLNRLHPEEFRNSKWLRFRVECPHNPTHRVQSWNAPGKCPKCGVYLDRNALPYRLWD